MTIKRIFGTDGAAVITGHVAVYNNWQLVAAQAINRVAAYGDTYAWKKGGVKDLTGNAGGGFRYDTTSSAPNITTASASGVSSTFTAATGCTISGTFILSSITISHNFEAGVTFSANVDFSGNGGTSPTEAWDETA